MSVLATTKAALEKASPLKVLETDHKAKGYHLDASFAAGSLVEAVKVLDGLGFFIETITGVDWLGEKEAAHKEAAAAAAKVVAAKAAKAKAEAEAAAKAAAEAGEAGEGGGPEKPADPEPKAEAEAPAQVEAAPAGPDDMEVVYDFNHFQELCRVVLRVRVPRDNPVVPTISDIYQAAHWHERETRDFFGITFQGHPYLVPLLLPEDADFHPLRKDYKP